MLPEPQPIITLPGEPMQQSIESTPIPVVKVHVPPKSGEIVCELTNPAEIEKILRNLRRRSLSEFKDHGIYILYATFGFLNWKDTEFTNGSVEEIRSPLLLIPIQLDQDSMLSPFKVSMPVTEDDAVLNPALDAKLRNDFKIELPRPPEDWGESSLQEYLGKIREMVGQRAWTVEETTGIGLYNFHKFQIYKDLESNKELISKSPMVQALAGQPVSGLIFDDLPNESQIDQSEKPENTFNVLEADGSQRICIDYAMKGQSFVMNGPPGTGKSQTIANMIAQAIIEGKSVLFVSEKVTALEMVYKRLRQVGLDRFCLMLHSEKANKQEVVAELKRALDEDSKPKELPTQLQFESLQQLRSNLNGYVQSLHAVRNPLGVSAYRVMGEIAKLRSLNTPYVATFLDNPSSMTPQVLQSIEQQVLRLSNVWKAAVDDDFPWRGSKFSEVNVATREEVSSRLGNLISSLDELQLEGARLSLSLGLDPPETLEDNRWLVELATDVFSSPLPERSWVLSTNLEGLISEAKDNQSLHDEILKKRNTLLTKYRESVFLLEDDILERINEVISRVSDLIGRTDPQLGSIMVMEIGRMLSFLELSRNAIPVWARKAGPMCDAFGVNLDSMSVERFEALANLCMLCFADEKPDLRWLKEAKLPNLEQKVELASRDYERFKSLNTEIARLYSKEIFNLNLGELRQRFNGPYRSRSRFLRRSYYKDREALREASLTGKIPVTIVEDLGLAIELVDLKGRIDASGSSLALEMGRFYHGYETDFAAAKRAIGVGSAILGLAKILQLTENSISLVVSDEVKDNNPSFNQEASELLKALEVWKTKLGELETFLPQGAIIPISAATLMSTNHQKLVTFIEGVTAQCNQFSSLMNMVSQESKQPGIMKNDYDTIVADLKTLLEVKTDERKLAALSSEFTVKYGSRYRGLSSDWNEILRVMDWTRRIRSKLVGHAFAESPEDSNPIVPSRFVDSVSQGRQDPPVSSVVLKRHLQEVMSGLSYVQSLFEVPLQYEGQDLLSLDVYQIEVRMRSLIERTDDIQVWVDFVDCKKKLSESGLLRFFQSLCELRPSSNIILSIFRLSFEEEWLDALRKEDAFLGNFRRADHEKSISEFQIVDKELIRLAAYKIIAEESQRKPQAVIFRTGGAEISVLRGEAAKRNRVMPIRRLFQRIPKLLLTLKPCLLMNPLAVSRLLTADSITFDIVIFDEASQVVPEDAIGAIYRGKTVVVAGDNKQLPPTNFFGSTQYDDDDAWEETDDSTEVHESILDKFSALDLPVKTLKWHYRSKHEDLIAFSNYNFYERQLITFPNPNTKESDLGVKFEYVANGVYDRGGSRTNRVEAEKVADLVMQHYETHPEKSLLVVTLNIPQMDLIDEVIRERRKQRPEFEIHFDEKRMDGRLEGFDVKNLERVQGDERDVIIFSVGYGKDSLGGMSMNFGPLNKSGGERRLNVAITRAREKTIVVASIKASDIDLSKAAVGVRMLHDYLDYAERGQVALQSASGTQILPYESPFEEDVAGAIQKMGYVIVPQVGCSGYRIDLGVVDPENPGRFILGVECDGATYHSSYCARDRDRLRQHILEEMGWSIYRIWAPAWVTSRKSETDKLRERIETARQELNRPAPLLSPIAPGTTTVLGPPQVDTQPSKTVDIQRLIGIEYIVAKLRPKYKLRVVLENDLIHAEKYWADLVRLLIEVVKVEGPVHLDCATQRIAEVSYFERLSPRVASAVRTAARQCSKQRIFEMRGEFIWPTGVRDIRVRIPNALVKQSQRKLEFIPPEEIQEAMKRIVGYAMSIPIAALTEETARLFGFSKMSEQMANSLNLQVTQMIAKGILVSKEGVLALSDTTKIEFKR
jgi:very-short-patch-repair endonuclease